MSVALESTARHLPSRPEVLRSAGTGGRLIDLRRQVPAPLAAPTGAPSVLTTRPPGLRVLRTVVLGSDSGSALMWQRVAEAVLAAGPGAVVTVDATELPDLPADLHDFLAYAAGVLDRRGGILRLLPTPA